MQARLKIGATLAQTVQSPGSGGTPNVYKRLFDCAIVKRMEPSLCRCITRSLAQILKQGPPLGALWRSRLRRIQSPERGCDRKVAPSEALVKVQGIVGGYNLKPGVQHSGIDAQFAGKVTPSGSVETLVQSPALPEHPIFNPADKGTCSGGQTFSHCGLNQYLWYRHYQSCLTGSCCIHKKQASD
jgi:hypothetical protein